MGVIFFLSTRAGGTQNSNGLIIWFLGYINPEFLHTLNEYQLYCLDFALRKFCHVSEYFILYLLVFRALRHGRYEAGRTPLKLFFGALALTMLYAITDEFHQMFVKGRSPAIKDVLIDSSGGLLSLGITLWFHIVSAIELRMKRTSTTVSFATETSETPETIRAVQ